MTYIVYILDAVPRINVITNNVATNHLQKLTTKMVECLQTQLNTL